MKADSSLDPYFDIWKGKVARLIDEHPLQIISWEATRRCNLRCNHCGSPSEFVNLKDEMTTEEVIGAFDQIARDFDMSGFRHINITGGEPFVREDLFNILTHLASYSFYRNIDIQTNGLYIAEHPEILPFLKDNGVTGLGISIDGLGETHDHFRNYTGGFEKSVFAAQQAVSEGMVVTVSVVAHSGNVDHLEELYEFALKEISPRVFRVMFIDPIGRTDHDSKYLLNDSQKSKIIRFLQEKYESTCQDYPDRKTMMVELGCGGWFGRELEGTFRPFIFHCIAGLNNLGILYDGKLASCSNISREFIEGDLRKEKIRDVWENKYQRYRNRTWRKTGKCENCLDWDLCHGGAFHLKENPDCKSNV